MQKVGSEIAVARFKTAAPAVLVRIPQAHDRKGLERDSDDTTTSVVPEVPLRRLALDETHLYR